MTERNGRNLQQQAQTTDVAVLKTTVVDAVEQRIRELHERGQIRFPANYSPENALRAAWLAIQEATDKNGRPALEVCTRNSIANALLHMVVQGLNPAKDQCYFVVYGNQLVCMRSYFGSMAVVQNYVAPKAKIWYGVVYEGDEFEFELRNGFRVPTVHKQRLQNIKPDKIVAAYCVIEDREGNLLGSEIMTFEQIRKSWENHSRTYKPGGDSFHNTEPDQAALRTVINRACKFVINSSDDSCLIEAVNRSDEEASEAEFEAEVAENANGKVIDVEGEVVGAGETGTNGSAGEHGKTAAWGEPPVAETEPVQHAADGPSF